MRASDDPAGSYITLSETQPPVYENKPRVKELPRSWNARISAPVTVRVNKREIDFGDLITGEITLSLENDLLLAHSLHVTLGLREEVKEQDRPGQFGLIAKRNVHIDGAYIGFEHGSLKAGYSYTFPFVLRMADANFNCCKVCSNPGTCFHSSLPASLGTGRVIMSPMGAIVEYSVTAKLVGIPLQGTTSLRFLPTSVTCDINQISTSGGKPYKREYSSVSRLSEPFIMRSVKRGYLTVLLSGLPPVVDYTQTKIGTVDLNMKVVFSRLSEPSCDLLRGITVQAASYSLTKVVYSKPHGIGSELGGAEGGRVERYMISSGPALVESQTFDTPRMSSAVRVSYSLRTVVDLSATTLSPISGVGYELNLTLRCRTGKLLLTIPVIMGLEAAPGYDKVVGSKTDVCQNNMALSEPPPKAYSPESPPDTCPSAES